jgi:hypothetical protein
MLKYLIGIIGITSLMILWVIVQNLWRRTFSNQQKDEDVLAGRSACGSCGCGTICKNKEVELKN